MTKNGGSQQNITKKIPVASPPRHQQQGFTINPGSLVFRLSFLGAGIGFSRGLEEETICIPNSKTIDMAKNNE